MPLNTPVLLSDAHVSEKCILIPRFTAAVEDNVTVGTKA